MKALFTSLLFTATITAAALNPNPIRVNQVGYLPNAAKTASVEQSAWSKKYTLTDDKGRKVWKGKATRTATSPWSGKQRAIIDFSEVTTPGTYTLSNGKEKQQIIIADNIYHDLAIASAKAYYLMRTGTPILAEYAGKYARPAAHMDNHVLIHPSAATEKRPAGTVIKSSEGWYDAGDYNKYIVNSAYTVALMMDAYEMNPDYYNHLSLNIPESGNATPDLLDEIAFNLRWMLTMQDPDDGGVYHKLTTPSFEAFIMPTDCQQQRYVVQKTTAATYDFAATMAKAYRVYSQFPEYKVWADGALEQAKRAYDWAERNPNVLYLQNEMNKQHQPAVTTGAYDDSNIKDEALWAAAELFFATGDNKYMNPLARNYQSLSFSNPSWGGVMGLIYYSAVSMLDSGNLPYAYEIGSQLKGEIKAMADSYLSSVATSCFDSPCGNSISDFGWGCNGEQVCGKGIILLYAYKLTGDTRYLDGAHKVADYLLGRNATGYCFVTGFGTFSPMHPHQRLSEADGIEEPLPGFLVGGPNPGQQDKATAGAYPSDLPDESYLDAMPSYASNEIAINWNAPLVAFIGWLDALSKK